MARRIRLFVLAVTMAALSGCTASLANPPSPTGIPATATAVATPTVSPTPTEATPTETAEALPSATSRLGLAPTGPTQVAQVASITDGDTIRVLIDGVNYPVRYIGMDTPETHNGVEWMGPEAAAANARLVEGRQVVLEKDVSETDRYGRLLRYVWLHDAATWTLVNLELIREGFAQVATFPPDVKYIEPLFVPAEREARAAGLGLWSGGPSPTPAATAGAPRGLVGGSCEPSYPDICIPLNSPDLDCGDITARRFRVLWNVANPDPMRFDGNHDGIGCES